MKYTSGKTIINVYRYMEMCGLSCKKRKGVRLSHEAIERRLYKRYQMFPDKIILPERIDFNSYNNENVLKGEIIEVVDDYNNIIAYKNPIRINEEKLMSYLISEASKKDLAKIRNAILKEQGYEVIGNGEIVTEEEAIEATTDLYEITGKPNRSKSFANRGGRSLKRRKNII